MERQNLSFRRKVWQIDGWFTIVLWLRSHCAIYACATLAESRHLFVLQPGKTKLWQKMRGSLPRKAECSTVVCARLFQVLIISHLSFSGLMSLTSGFLTSTWGWRTQEWCYDEHATWTFCDTPLWDRPTYVTLHMLTLTFWPGSGNSNCIFIRVLTRVA